MSVILFSAFKERACGKDGMGLYSPTARQIARYHQTWAALDDHKDDCLYLLSTDKGELRSIITFETHDDSHMRDHARNGYTGYHFAMALKLSEEFAAQLRPHLIARDLSLATLSWQDLIRAPINCVTSAIAMPRAPANNIVALGAR